MTLSTMYTTAQLSEIINSAISSINYPDSPSGLYNPIKYTLDGGGKRIRPVLLLSACAALGSPIEQAINQAIGVEMFHNFTLVHDDVMDNADTRRGKPAVHKKWNLPTAILSGDAMLTIATQYIAKVNNEQNLKPVLELFNTTAMQIYEGQQYDMDFESMDDVTVEQYLHMITLKTSVLLGCACQMGAIIAGASKSEQNSFYSYGVKLGLAFQLKDDYLDTYGDPKIFGKKIGGDILNDKKTWLLISALNEDTTGDLKTLIGSASEPNDKIAKVIAIYNRLELPSRCHDLIDQYISEAIDEIKSLNISNDSKEFFISLATQQASRNH